MRKFLVVMDDTAEFLNALRFATIRAEKTGGIVMILGIVGPDEFQHWLGVGETMREEARERIRAHFDVFKKWMDGRHHIEPELMIREGDRAQQILEAIQEDPEIGVLVLGASTDRKGPGPLITQLVAKKGGEMPIPITIVPGKMSKDDIIAVA